MITNYYQKLLTAGLPVLDADDVLERANWSRPLTDAEKLLWIDIIDEAGIQGRTEAKDLKAQVMDAVTRLQGIQNAGTIPFTQAGFTQVVNAVKDMALYEEKIIRVLARII